MNKQEVLKQGFLDGVKTTWELAKIIVPVYIVITFLKHSFLIEVFVTVFEPVTSLVGLPGEAALPLVLAACINVYPAIPSIMAFSFSAQEITIISTMILLCHSLPLEGTLAKKAGASPWKIISIRVVCAFFAGFILNLMLGG